MSLARKLILSFLGIALLLLIGGVASIIQVNRVGQEAINIGERKLPLTKAILKLRIQLGESRIKIEEVIQQKRLEKVKLFNKEYLSHIGKAGYWANAIRNGDQTGAEKIYKTLNPVVQKKVSTATKELLSFQESGSKLIQYWVQTIEKENRARKNLKNIEAAYNRIIDQVSEEEEVLAEEPGKKKKKSKLDLGHIVPQLDICRELMSSFLYTDHPEILKAIEQDLHTNTQDLLLDIQEILKEMENNRAFPAADKEKAANVKREVEEFIQFCRNLISAKFESLQTRGLADESMKEFEGNFYQIMDLMAETETAINREVLASVKKAKQRTLSAAVMMAVITVAGLAAAVFFGFFQARSIANPIHQVMEVANNIAEKNLSDEDITASGSDEVVRLSGALNHMKTNLAEIVGRIKKVAENVAQESVNISRRNQDLSQRSQEQTAALQETASTIEEMSANISSNTDSSREADSMVKEAVKAAQNGDQVVQKAIGSMTEVSFSSQKISEIINVVNDIAFQTNLLALNAAVEAARAGEQGRGFAVVAGEVRSLAGRSAEAAKEIKELIDESVKKVNIGNHLVEETGQTLTEIIRHISQVAEKITEISYASQEQSSGMNQVNLAINQIDEVVQQNAFLVEEAASASEVLSAEAEGLNNMMSEFKVTESQPTNL
ncbi:MAG: methyl-accepting chemotaxis protein [bacterium]